MVRKVRIWLLLLGVVPAIRGHGGELSRFEFNSVHMATRARLVFYAESESVAKLAADEVFAKWEALEQAFSDYRPSSEIRRLTAAAVNTDIPVSPDLFQLLVHAQTFAADSGGAFDITVGPLTRLWRRARRQRHPPRDELLDQALQRVDYRQLTLRPETQSVSFSRAGLSLDLGGIAKGYALDEALSILSRHGIDRALADLGGDLALGTAPPERSGWTVRVEPFARDIGPSSAEASEARPVLSLIDCGIATSGSAYQYLELEGRQISHLIDPRTGKGVDHGWAVTVVARSCLAADALASAAAVLGPSESEALLVKYEAAGCFARPGPRGPQWQKTARFSSLPLRTGN